MVKLVSVTPLLFTLASLLTACNFQESKLDGDAGFGEYTPADLNYATVQRRILEPYCLSCHSLATGNRGGINLETRAGITSRLDSIHRTTIMERSMPPSSEAPLPDAAILMLDAWLSLGAPE